VKQHETLLPRHRERERERERERREFNPVGCSSGSRIGGCGFEPPQPHMKSESQLQLLGFKLDSTCCCESVLQLLKAYIEKLKHGTHNKMTTTIHRTQVDTTHNPVDPNTI